MVWAYNEETGETALQEVTATMQREVDATVYIELEGETIETTAEHPFFTRSGWKDAADLTTEDFVQTKHSEWKAVKAQNFSYETKKVFNFEVANWHTYFVGVLAWLVHNTKVCLSTLPKQIHHFATNKSKKFTKELEKIAKKYDLNLDGKWNKELLPHRGRHPYDYHRFVLDKMQKASKKAGKNKDKFLELFEKTVKEPIRKNPELLRKSGWKIK